MRGPIHQKLRRRLLICRFMQTVLAASAACGRIQLMCFTTARVIVFKGRHRIEVLWPRCPLHLLENECLSREARVLWQLEEIVHYQEVFI